MGVILITCRNRAYAATHYLPPLVGAGWKGSLRVIAVEDPIQPPDLLLSGVNGLLLTGGKDIHPRTWDSLEPIHLKAEVDSERDSFEIPLVQAAWEKGLPILGICRGAQILNVALGGSLVQDIPSSFGCPEDQHRHPAPSLRHRVDLVPGTLLASLLGLTQAVVNSRHHQAVLRLATALRPAAYDPGTRGADGALVEAVESRHDDHWAVGVQWHPEDLVGLEGLEGDAARKLFEGFVRRAQDQIP